MSRKLRHKRALSAERCEHLREFPVRVLLSSAKVLSTRPRGRRKALDLLGFGFTGGHEPEAPSFVHQGQPRANGSATLLTLTREGIYRTSGTSERTEAHVSSTHRYSSTYSDHSGTISRSPPLGAFDDRDFIQTEIHDSIAANKRNAAFIIDVHGTNAGWTGWTAPSLELRQRARVARDHVRRFAT